MHVDLDQQAPRRALILRSVGSRNLLSANDAAGALNCRHPARARDCGRVSSVIASASEAIQRRGMGCALAKPIALPQTLWPLCKIPTVIRKV